jgi:hypothetical protein
MAVAGTVGWSGRRLTLRSVAVLLLALTGFVVMHVVALTDVAPLGHHVMSAPNGVQRAAEPHVVAPGSESAVSGESTTNDPAAGASLRTPAVPLEPSSVPEEGHHDGHLGLVGCLVALTGLVGWLVVARPSGGYLLAVARRAVTSSGLGVGWAVPSGLPRAPVRRSLCVLRI